LSYYYAGALTEGPSAEHGIQDDYAGKGLLVRRYLGQIDGDKVFIEVLPEDAVSQTALTAS
jgi:hypothetical protein